MQRCNCTVRTEPGTTVTKVGVSVAEIAVLRYIHGEDAVYNISRTKNDKMPHRQELDELMQRYRGTKYDDTGKVDVVPGLFPGLNAQLPVHLEDIGITKDSPFLAEKERATSRPQPKDKTEGASADATAAA